MPSSTACSDPGGHLVFSVTHPSHDAVYFGTEGCFATELVGSEWGGFGPRVYVPSFRRSLESTLRPLLGAGFRLERLVEPRPTEAFREADPAHYEELSRAPCFLCVRASKDVPEPSGASPGARSDGRPR